VLHRRPSPRAGGELLPGIPDDSHLCGKENPDCTVCRPVTITLLPGSTAVQQAGA